jgi:conjugal transfer/entry exclusion protein
MGLLDNPKDAAMLQMGLGLLSRSGPSRMPVSLGQALGDSGQEAMGTYQQVDQANQMKQMRDMQMQQQRAQAEEAARRQAALKAFRDQLPPQLQNQFDVDPHGFMQQMYAKPKVHVVDGALVDESGNVKYQGTPKAATDIEKLIAARDRYPIGDPNRKLFDAAIAKASTHAPQVNVSYGSPVAGEDDKGNKVFFQPDKKGGTPAIIKGVKPSGEVGKAPTEAETKAAFYAGNMKAATRVLDQLEKEGLDMSKLGSQVDTAMAGGMGNLVSSPRAQQARQAQNQWAEQMLRMQTGAAATQDEITRTVATYFPKPGDSSEVVAQKKAMRAQAEQGVFAASGRAQSRVPSGGGKTAVRRGTYGGKPVIQYDDGSVEYAD